MIGMIAIGRNEGERFRRCLASLKREGERIVYVDSGSTDDSVAHATREGVDIVTLDKREAFTAARARNAGFERLVALWPDADLVFFIDGDCELAPGFIAAASRILAERADIGVVTGRVREKNRDASIYNRLCDLEWSGPSGEIRAAGGIFLVRRADFAAVGGFNPAVVAAEDDELCIRIRQRGLKIWRIAQDMCFHDAGMTRFSQWWRRAFRAGYAYAQVGSMHRDYFKAERLRSIAWGLVLPALALLSAPPTRGLSLLLFLLYPASFVRTRQNLLKDGAEPGDAGVYAAFLTLSKFPNFLGIADFWRKRLLGAPVGIVEYK
jgi:GT2 family glycosyltransferase